MVKAVCGCCRRGKKRHMLCRCGSIMAVLSRLEIAYMIKCMHSEKPSPVRLHTHSAELQSYLLPKGNRSSGSNGQMSQNRKQGPSTGAEFKSQSPSERRRFCGGWAARRGHLYLHANCHWLKISFSFISSLCALHHLLHHRDPLLRL